MPLWTTPLPLGTLLDNSNAGNNNDWFATSGGLSRDDNKLRAPVFNASAPASPIDPSDNPNFSGGLLGRLVAPAGIAPQNLDQPAPPDDEREQADMTALDARLASSGNIRDAVALYNARKSSRR
jgi:hypothetical protein